MVRYDDRHDTWHVRVEEMRQDYGCGHLYGIEHNRDNKNSNGEEKLASFDGEEGNEQRTKRKEKIIRSHGHNHEQIKV